MSSHHANTNKLIIGAILGSIVAGTSAAFLASKSGKALRAESAKKLQNIKNNFEELLESVGDTTHAIEGKIYQRADDYSEKIQDFVQQVNDHIKSLDTDENKEELQAFLIGGILGGIVGIGVAALSTSEEEKSSFSFRNVGFSTASLKHTAQEILNALEEQYDRCERPREQLRAHGSVDDVLDFVTTGIKLWQRVKNRER